MRLLFDAATLAAIVRLECPRCGYIQARARTAKGVGYTCKKCGRPIPATPPTPSWAPKR